MLIEDAVTEQLPDWNQCVKPENAALEFCRLKEIRIVDDKKQKFGKLKFYKGYVFILINPKLSPAMRLWVLWHEIGHFILHSPQTSNFSKSMKRKYDRQANTVAAISMMPKNIIEFLTPEEIQEEYGYPMELIEIRLEILEKQKR